MSNVEQEILNIEVMNRCAPSYFMVRCNSKHFS